MHYTRLSISSRKLAISNEMLSDYCKKITGKYEIKIGDVKSPRSSEAAPGDVL